MNSLAAFLIAMAIAMSPIAAHAVDPEPEFDGTYAMSKEGKFIELSSNTVWRSVLINPDAYQLNDKIHTVFYIVDKAKRAVMKSEDFSAVVVRGKLAASRLSLHKLTTTALAPREVVENETTPLLKKGKPYFVATGSFELRSKSTGQTRYYLPKEPLVKGEYIINLAGSYWIIEIQ